MNEDFRPSSLDDYTGQEAVKARLRPHIALAIGTHQPLRHVLLTGAPGLGKTTLANLIAEELAEYFTVLDLAGMTDKRFLSFMRRFEGGVLFVDEIHRAAPKQQEMILQLAEEGFVATPVGGRLEFDWITIIAATTEPQKLVPAVTARFPIQLKLKPYSEEEMTTIVRKMAESVGLEIPVDEAQVMAAACAGIPRTARHLVHAYWALDHAGEPSATGALGLVGLEADGLSDEHLAYLRVLDALDGQAGISTIASLLNAHPATVMGLERLLIERRYIGLHPQGRVLTPAGDRRIHPRVEGPKRRRQIA